MLNPDALPVGDLPQLSEVCTRFRRPHGTSTGKKVSVEFPLPIGHNKGIGRGKV